MFFKSIFLLFSLHQIFIFLYVCVFFPPPGNQKLTLSPDRGTALSISSRQVKGCKVCTGTGRSQRCSTSLLLKDSAPVTVEFECSRPQDEFSVEIVRNIGKSDCYLKGSLAELVQNLL